MPVLHAPPLPKMRRALLLWAACALALASAGCVKEQAPLAPAGEKTPTPNAVAMRVAAFPWQSRLQWLVTIHDNTTRSYPDAHVEFSVEKRGGIPVGQDSGTAQVEPDKDAQLHFSTPSFGYGDYFWHV